MLSPSPVSQTGNGQHAGVRQGAGRAASDRPGARTTRKISVQVCGCMGPCGSPGDDIVGGVNVRRLAAIDMYGTQGTMRRRRIILAEFIVGVVVMVGIGAWLAAFSSSLGGRLLGVWMAGSGLNYAPLGAHAIALSRPGALDAELAGVDTGRELRRYSILQIWIFVPLSLVVFATHSAFSRRA
jgi:hypothetical protein